MKILYVEDNEDNIYMLRSRLARAGFTVVVATDGAQGVAMAASEQPDLVLMDLSLPGLDGWEAARRIKEGLHNLVVPGVLFEELGLKYFGPIDGHDLDVLTETLSDLKRFEGPVLLHVVTKKGKGYGPAEGDAGTFHGVGVFDPDTFAKLQGRRMSLAAAAKFGVAGGDPAP